MASAVGPSSRPARAPGANWEDSFFNLDSRHRQLKKRFNEQEEELKRLRVAQRKTESQEARRPGAASGTRGSFSRPATSGSEGGGARPALSQPSQSLSRQPPVPSLDANREYVSVPQPSAVQANEAHSSAIHTAMVVNPDPGAALPDPAMIWGSEGSVQNYIAANALYHANEELRRKLDESSAVVQALQTELSATRTLCTNAQTRIQDLAQQMHQLVRERDLAAQKLATAQQSIQDFERTLQGRIRDEEKTRFELEGQLAELRSRLVVGADSNELLSRDVRTLLQAAKERTAEVVSLRSKLALAESGLSSQRHTNENLLLELTSLNAQLVEERKRSLTAAREAHSAALAQDRLADLENHIRRLTEERSALESERARLTGELVRATEDALRHARNEVRADLDDWRNAATHWEEVAQLLYKDVRQRTSAHLRCRAECDEAKAARDLAGMELRATTDALARCRAKLEIVWPTHDRDADGLTAEEILETFRRHHHHANSSRGEPGTYLPAGTPADNASDGARKMNVSKVDGERGLSPAYAAALGELPADPTTGVEKLHELQEANAALVAELEQLRLASELLQDRLAHVEGRERQAIVRAEQVAKEGEGRERAGQRVLARQVDRVLFLEAQVRSLRGYQVEPTTSVESVSADETVLELFLGQLVAAEAPAQMDVPEAFSQLFCSADFLLHETITTPAITGLNGFFDTTAAFCISMDALLLYYLQTRKLLVQLHRLRGPDEVAARVADTDAAAATSSHARITAGSKGQSREGSTGSNTSSHDASGSLAHAQHMFETVAEGSVDLFDLVALPACRDAARPTLRGHIRLVTASGRHIASLEFQLTARTPFTDAFRHLAEETVAACQRDANLKDDKEAGEGSGQPPSRQPAAASSAQPAGSSGGTGCGPADQNAVGSMHFGVHEWIRRSSRASSVAGHGARKPGPPQQLLPPSSVSRSNGSATSSLDSSSRLPTPDIRHGPLRSHAAPRGVPYTNPAYPVPSPLRTATTTAAVTAPVIRSVAVDVVRLELPADMITPVPRLSCLYALPALQKEVRLAAPDRPRYTVEYTQPNAEFGTVFALDTPAAQASLAREPISFFFIDEDAPAGAPRVWGMALCEWVQVLANSGRTHSFTLPLLRQSVSTNGVGGRDMVRGAVLRVRLLASTEIEPHPVGNARAWGNEGTPVVGPQVSQTHVLPSQEQPQQPLMEVDALPPSPLTALQRLLQQARMSGGEGPTAGPALQKQQQQHPGALSMDEELMALEYGRLTRRQEGGGARTSPAL